MFIWPAKVYSKAVSFPDFIQAVGGTKVVCHGAPKGRLPTPGKLLLKELIISCPASWAGTSGVTTGEGVSGFGKTATPVGIVCQAVVNIFKLAFNIIILCNSWNS